MQVAVPDRSMELKGTDYANIYMAPKDEGKIKVLRLKL